MNEEFLKLFDSYTVQNIDEGEFYTLVKGDLKVYLSHFSRECDMYDMGNDEAKVSVFKDHLNISTHSGNLEGIISEVKKLLNESVNN